MLIDRRSSVEYVEVKSNKKYQPDMLSGISTLLKEKEKATVLYQGKSFTHSSTIEIKNYGDYLME